MLREFTLIQYEAYLRCWGMFDSELEEEMVDTLQGMGTVPRIIRGRIVSGRVLEQPIPGLEIYITDANRVFSLCLDLHSRIGRMLLRRLVMADSKCDLEIEFWDCDWYGNQLPDRYVSVRQQGLLLFDPYVAVPSAFAAAQCDVNDANSVERVLLQAEEKLSLAWHVELGRRLVAIWFGIDRLQLLEGAFSPGNMRVKPPLEQLICYPDSSELCAHLTELLEDDY
jgi:hypothetical protein